MTNYDFNKIYEWPRIPRIFFISLVASIVFFVGYFFDISTLATQLDIERGKEKALIHTYKDVVKKQVVANTTLQHLPIMKNILNEWKKKLVSPVEITESLNQILKAGTSNNLQLSLFKSDAPRVEGKRTKFPINIEMTGTYDSTASFISQIASMPILIKINDLTIINTTADSAANDKSLPKLLSSTNKLKTNLILEVYEEKHEE